MQHTVRTLTACSIAALFGAATPLSAQKGPVGGAQDIGAAEADAPVVEVDPALQAAEAALEAAPVFDGHNDVPIQLRRRFENQINDFDFVDTTDTGPEVNGNPMHSDLTRLEAGRVGAQFWSVFVPTSLSEPQACLLYTSPSPRDQRGSRMPSSA